MRRCDVVVPIRPHIVCCVVHNIAIDAGMLKKFLTAQVRDRDSYCTPFSFIRNAIVFIE